MVAAGVLMPDAIPAQTPLTGLVTVTLGRAAVVRAATAQHRQLEFKDEVYPGDEIFTHKASQVRVLLDAGTRVTVRENAVLTIGAEAGGTSLTLTTGSIRYVVDRQRTPPGAVYEVWTPTAALRLQGTILSVTFWPTHPFRPSGLTYVCVLSGMVSARPLGGEEIQIGPDGCAFVEEIVMPEPRWREAPPRRREAPPRDDLTIGSR